jgi:hypothetical protein
VPSLGHVAVMSEILSSPPMRTNALERKKCSDHKTFQNAIAGKTALEALSPPFSLSKREDSKLSVAILKCFIS